MKLSDYNSKAPISRKKPQQVFNLHNEYREEQLKQEIQTLKEETDPLRPLPKRILELEQEVDTLKPSLAKVNKELAEVSRTLETKELANQKLLKQVKTFSDLRQEYERTLSIVATKESELQNELKYQRTLVAEKEELLSFKIGLEGKIDELDQEVIKLKQLNSKITLESTTVTSDNIQLKELVTKVNKENKSISKLNTDLNQELGYYKINLTAAKQKIEELTYIKDKLATWGDKLTKDYSQETSKKDALNNKIQDREEIIADLSNNITELIASREELLSVVQYYRMELSRQRPVGTDGLFRQVEMPFASEIIKRRYVGTGKPTMLKFKPRGDMNNDNAI